MMSTGTLLVLLSLLIVTSCQPKTTMVWMCLERCDENKTEILSMLHTIQHKAPTSLSSVSFELYNIGASSSLIKNSDLSPVGPILQKMTNCYGKQMETFPMISSYPYPKELIDWMRYLFENPEPFIQQAISEAVKYGWNGYNLDLEPVAGVEEADAINYAKFIGKFAAALHQKGMKLNVDTAAWSILWNYGLISRALVAEQGDVMITMGTYTANNTSWLKQLDKVVAESDSLDKVGIGLMPLDNSDVPISRQDIDFRFARIKEHKIRNVEIWKADQQSMSDDSYWWTVLSEFIKDQ